jgi:uncharacterized cupredoxin-like copper-binding protein
VRKLSILIVAAAVAAAGVLAAVPAVAATSAATDKFCDANFKISQVFNDGPDGDSSAKEIKAFMKRITPLFEQATNTAPPEVATAVDTAVTALTDDLETAFEDPAVGQAVGEIDAWAVENCGYEVFDVTATEYSFSGIPTSAKTGKTALVLDNSGSEYHEVLVVRRKNNKSVDDLLALSETQAEKQTEYVGSVVAAPDQTLTTYFDIKKPGKYLAICTLPVGITDFENFPEDAAPHFTEGMVEEFTVS